MIARDRGLLEKITGDVISKLSEGRSDADLYRMWIDNYIYGELRLQDLDNEDEEYIRAFTRCSDRDLLGGLLYAYYHLGDVRNATNHAVSGNDEIVVRMEDSDVSERMNLIKDTIENFIYMCDKVSENIAGSEAEVLTITDEEIRAYAASLRREFAKSRDKAKH